MTGQETVTHLDSVELGTAAAQAQRKPAGEPDRCGQPTGHDGDHREEGTEPGSMERTRLPPSQGAGEAAVQRIGGRPHQSDDELDGLQERSRVAEQQMDTTRRQCHQIRRGLISEVPAQQSSAKAEHSLRRPDEGGIGDA